MSDGGSDHALLGAFEALARRAPGRPAIISGASAIPYGTLCDDTRRLARALAEDGVRAGDRVALLLDNSPEFIVAYLATLASGAVAVPFNPKAPVAAIARVFDDCGPIAAFFQPSNLAAAGTLGAGVPGFVAAYTAGLSRSERAGGAIVAGIRDRISRVARTGELAPPAADALALIVYTSGTTGTPKGVMLSHAVMREVAAAGRAMLQLRPDERIGAVVPLFHLYGLREIDLALSTGATIVVPRERNFAATILAELRDAGIGGLSSVPSALAILLERYRVELADCLGGVRYLTIGTAPMPARNLAALREVLPRTRIITTYGLTEASRVCWTDVTDSATPPDPRHVGRPYLGVELRLFDEIAGVGRVALKSGMVMKGYWRNAAATREILLDDGTLLTPDCGRIAPDGSLHLLGRMDDVINCGGQKVSPVEIEEVIAGHPEIAAVTVLGIPDPDGLLGEVAQAVIVAKEGTSLTAADVREYAGARLESYKVPRAVEFVRDIPLSVLGKPRRAQLKGP